MNPNIYRQTDKRWKSLPYPTSDSSFGGNACGGCAVLHCIIEQKKYTNWTPKDIQPYMKQFAEAGHGTLWSGIKTALEHFGMKNVKWFKKDAKMSEVFAELNKKNRLGVLLLDGTGPDGTVWTTSGHYVNFVSYKYENGKHWFYIKDSGDRHHDGWYSYEKSMKGVLPQVWTCTVPKETTKAYSGSYPNTNITKKVSTNNAGKIVSTAKSLTHPLGTASKKYAYDTGSPLSTYKSALKKYMSKTAKISLSDCGYFVNTTVRKSGVSSSFKALNGTKEAFPAVDKNFSKVYDGKKINITLKAGDVIRYKASSGQHTIIYASNGVIYDAGRGKRFPANRKSTNYKGSGITKVQVLRAKETTTTQIVRDYLMKGDNNAEVTKWKEYLKWYFGSKANDLNTSTKFGDTCEKWTKKFQEAEVGKGQGDGKVGPKTIAAAKAVKK